MPQMLSLGELGDAQDYFPPHPSLLSNLCSIAAVLNTKATSLPDLQTSDSISTLLCRTLQTLPTIPALMTEFGSAKAVLSLLYMQYP